MQATIDVAKYIQELLNRSNVQVRSLDQVDDHLKELYTTGNKKAILLYHSQVSEAPIRILDARRIEITDDTLPLYLKHGDMIIVLLPAPEGKRYVLQTTLEELFIDRFVLQILDPRATKRLKFAGHNMVFWQIPTVLMLKLEREELRLVREDGEMEPENRSKPKSWAEKQFQPGYNIIDYFSEVELDQVSLTYQALIDSEAVSAKLLDISRGGLCLRTKPGMGKNLKNHFLYIKLELVGVQQTGSKILPQPGIKIMTFAVVRSFKDSKKGDELHLMFLATLPETASAYFPGNLTKKI